MRILTLFSTTADAVDVYAINTPNIVQLTRRICRQQRIVTQNHRDQRKCIGWIFCWQQFSGGKMEI